MQICCGVAFAAGAELLTDELAGLDGDADDGFDGDAEEAGLDDTVEDAGFDDAAEDPLEDTADDTAEVSLGSVLLSVVPDSSSDTCEPSLDPTCELETVPLATLAVLV